MVLHALTQVALPVFAVVGVGWALGRWGKLPGPPLTTLLLYVSIPALLFDSLAHRAPEPAAFGRVAIAAATVCLGLALFAWLVAPLVKIPRRALVLTSGFMNAGNFGLPFALLAWGEAALTHAVTFYVIMSISQSTIGIWIAWGKPGGYKEVLRLPLIYAAAAGLAVGWGELELPTVVARPTELLGQTAVPLMLIALGRTLQAIQPSAVARATFAAVFRIGGGFALAWLFCELSEIEGLMRNVVLLSGSMPSAVMNAVLAERYGAHPKLVATTVLVSTLMAVVTVPALIVWLG